MSIVCTANIPVDAIGMIMIDNSPKLFNFYGGLILVALDHFSAEVNREMCHNFRGTPYAWYLEYQPLFYNSRSF